MKNINHDCITGLGERKEISFILIIIKKYHIHREDRKVRN
jgi:hypothetical protein